jgi:hypothetical protein
MRQDTLLAEPGHLSALRSLNPPYSESVLGAFAEPDGRAREKAFQGGPARPKNFVFLKEKRNGKVHAGRQSFHP